MFIIRITNTYYMKLKKWKVTLPNGEETFWMQQEKPLIKSQVTTTISINDSIYTYHTYNVCSVDVEELEFMPHIN